MFEEKSIFLFLSLVYSENSKSLSKPAALYTAYCTERVCIAMAVPRMLLNRQIIVSPKTSILHILFVALRLSHCISCLNAEDIFKRKLLFYCTGAHPLRSQWFRHCWGQKQLLGAHGDGLRKGMRDMNI
jgi:hypothetical protein